LLLSQGYEVHGIICQASTFKISRSDHRFRNPHVNGIRLFLHYGDLSDVTNLIKLFYRLQPDEIYHLGVQGHMRVSFDFSDFNADTTFLNAIRILETIS